MPESTAGLILQAARVLFRPGDVVELRVPKAGRDGTIAGYFDDFEKLAQAAAHLERGKYPGVYWSKKPGKWGACIEVKGKSFHLGFHIKEEDAANAYQKVLNTLG